MPLGDRPRDRQAESRAPPGPRRVAAVEPLEDRFLVAGRHPRAVVDAPRATTPSPSRAARSSIRDVAWATAFSTRLRTSRRSSSGSPTTGAAETAAVSTSGPPRRRTRAASSSTMSSRSSGRRVPGPLVVGDDEQQVAHQRVHLGDVPQEVAVQLLVVPGAGMGQRHLELGALRRQRAAQVVRDVGEEPRAAARGRAPDVRASGSWWRRAGRPRRRGPSSPTRRTRSSSVMRVDLLADPVEAAQGAADQQPGGRDEEQPEERYADPQPRAQAGGGLADRLQAGARRRPVPARRPPRVRWRSRAGSPRSRRRRDRSRPRRAGRRWRARR